MLTILTAVRIFILLRIKINLEPINTTLVIPVYYNYLVQAIIYRNLNKSLADKIHYEGYQFENRRFRMFTFSRLYGRFKRDGQYLIFDNGISLFVASPFTEILESFATRLVKKTKIKIGNSYCKIVSIEVLISEELTDKITIRTLSPITVYSTLKTLDNRRKTYYYSPFEPDFNRLIHQNLLKKYYILHKQFFDPTVEFSLLPLKVSKINEHIIYYKDTIVKAWSGIYQMACAPELLKIGFDCGLGSKNSQGFGMIEKYYPQRKGVI